jgi:formylglycine-generating enzyme required for sulfatase activity
MFKMVTVPAGKFQRDSIAENISKVSSFKIATQLVSRAQFERVMGVDPSKPNLSGIPGNAHPVQNINWYQAIAFCNRLSLLEQKSAVYSVDGIYDWSSFSFTDVPVEHDERWDRLRVNWKADGYRLPTAMEWHWAAMGAPADGQNGTNQSGFEKAYAGWKSDAAIVDYVRFQSETTAPVGSLKPNELGLYDMSGNVDELLWDLVGASPEGLIEDDRGADQPQGSTVKRLSAGCNFLSQESACQLDHSFVATDPARRFGNQGFRVARKE